MAFSSNAVLALGAALLWGGGDFTGGMGVRKSGGSVGAALRFVLLSHSLSFSVLVAAARIRGDFFPHGATLAWGIAGGIVGGLSIFLFYLALSRGAMGAAAPSADCSPPPSHPPSQPHWMAAPERNTSSAS